MPSSAETATGTLPAGCRVTLDPSVRQVRAGRVLIGGSPVRWFRLTEAGWGLVERLAGGAPVPDGPSAQRLVRRLLDAGAVHPRWDGSSAYGSADVTVVVPVRDGDVQGVLAGLGPVGRVVVVDDGSVPAVETPTGTVLRHSRPRGPAAARNTGWRQAETDLVAFVDADCEPSPGWLDPLLPHFGDPRVGAVAPRITAGDTSRLPASLAAYERARPALDRGPWPASVRPRSRVPFVPAAVLVVRRTSLEAVGGFDETLRVGEDVDCIWRLAAAGWTIRYEPLAAVPHRARRGTGAWLRQRFRYGTSAAPLARRHGAAVAPAALSAWSAVAWAAAARGLPAAALGISAGTSAVLARRITAAGGGRGQALRLAAQGHLGAGATLAGAVRRAWWPAVLPLAGRWRPARRVLVGSLLLPPLVEWWRERPPFGLATWTGLRLADDAAYSAGVWAGCLRQGSLAALAPEWRGRGRGAR
jgi:mycofactocin system glycosyltransferase